MDSAENQRKISRRRFVGKAAVGTAAAVGAGLLAGCSQTPQIVKETVQVPVEVIKKETVVVPAPTTAAPAAGPITLEVVNPTSAIEVTTLHAPRLDTLEGKTICELAMEWQAPRTFPYMREVLKKMYPTAKFIGWEEMPRLGGLDETGSELGPVVKAVQAAKCDCVIVGNAG